MSISAKSPPARATDAFLRRRLLKVRQGAHLRSAINLGPAPLSRRWGKLNRPSQQRYRISMGKRDKCIVGTSHRISQSKNQEISAERSVMRTTDWNCNSVGATAQVTVLV